MKVNSRIFFTLRSSHGDDVTVEFPHRKSGFYFEVSRSVSAITNPDLAVRLVTFGDHRWHGTRRTSLYASIDDLQMRGRPGVISLKSLLPIIFEVWTAG